MRVGTGTQLAIAVGLLAAARLASAAPVAYFDNFDSIPATQTNKPPPGWQTPYGTVDSLLSGSFNVNCAGGSGGCVDLDGSTRTAGLMTSLTTFNLTAGQQYALSFDYSGNQRPAFAHGTTDNLAFGVNSVGLNMAAGPNSTGTIDNIPWSQDFSSFTLLFTAARDGAAYAFFSNYGPNANDNVGTILDNVRLSAVPIPPAGWLLISGLIGLVGVARRKVAPVAMGGAIPA